VGGIFGVGDKTCVPLDGVRATTPVEETDPQRADQGASAKGFIAVIESRASLREWIRNSMQSAFSLPIILYSSMSELEGQLQQASPDLVIFSLMQSNEASVGALKVLLELAPTVPVIVLASIDDVDLARTLLRLGVKGYIPVTKGFEIAIEAVRFVLDGAGPMCGSTP
jgi:DNA-binding NarL/FixJ family response regulator